MSLRRSVHRAWALCIVVIAAVCASVPGGCGGGGDRLHANTELPLAAAARTVAETDLRGDFGPQYDRYLVVLGDLGVTAPQLARKETRLVRPLEWHRRTCSVHGAPRWERNETCWGSPPDDFVRYQPVAPLLARNRLPKQVAKLVSSTPGQVRRKLVVQLSPPEPQSGD